MTTRIFNNKDLYPTPKAVIEKMLSGVDLFEKTILEPSAGLGDIVDFCAGSGAKVLACEIVPELQSVLLDKNCKLIGEDFLKLTSERISHIDYIVMNPPFSADEKHILHAYKIAPDGCQIIALCNWETYNNYRLNRTRTEFRSLVQNYGEAENLGNCFYDAERKTEVEVALITLRKPTSKKTDEFEGFFINEEEEAQFDGIQEYNFVRDLVNRYVGAVKVYDEQIETALRMNELTNSFSRTKIALSLNTKDAELSREEYKKELQKDAWQFVIGKFNLHKYSTQGLTDDINKFVEQQTNIPFTMKNIYRMIEIIIGTTGNRMDKALEEVFDNMTKNYHNNRFGVEGWKTNSHYLLNEKFIMPWVACWNHRFSWIDFNDRACSNLDDFTKALCYITGDNYDGENWESKERKYPRLRWLNEKQIQWGQWVVWGFFEVKFFKKGTAHFKFKNRDVWALFNQNIARIKGFPLPESIKKSS